MTNMERILQYLRSIAPQPATNAEIRAHTGIKNHTDVYQNTQLLLGRGAIQGRQLGHEWRFWFGSAPATPSTRSSGRGPRTNAAGFTAPSQASQFEDLARQIMSEHFGVPLVARKVPGVHKTFDLVSEDLTIVGDAKYYTLVGGERLPPAKFSVIAEHVWLLEKTQAKVAFLVFGNEKRVPLWWLKRYGNLVSGIAFYFLTDDGELEHLTER